MIPKPKNMHLLLSAMRQIAEERHPGQKPCKTPLCGCLSRGQGYYYNDITGSTHVITERAVFEDGRFAWIYRKSVT
jgi:hypothetical protein